MLKFPSGWAAALDAARTIQMKKAATVKRTLASIALPLDVRERPRRLVSEEDVEVRIEGERAGEIRAGFFFLAEPSIDHAGVEKELRVFGAELQRLVDRGARLLWVAVAVKIPGENVVGVNIAAIFNLAPRQIEAILRFDIVVGVKIGELAVIQHAVERVQPADVFDQSVLPPRFLDSADRKSTRLNSS